jgi:hypothetical protein
MLDDIDLALLELGTGDVMVVYVFTFLISHGLDRDTALFHSAVE